jgi:hypothetical protein
MARGRRRRARLVPKDRVPVGVVSAERPASAAAAHGCSGRRRLQADVGPLVDSWYLEALENHCANRINQKPRLQGVHFGIEVLDVTM